MSAINIDIRKVRNANYELPPIISNLSAQKRYVNMLKLILLSEIQDRRHIRERIDFVLREMEKAEQQITEIYKVTGNVVTQYGIMEINLMANADGFE